MLPNTVLLLAGLPYAVWASTLPAQLEHVLLSERQTPDNSCVTGVHVIAGGGNGTGGTRYSFLGTLVTNITSMIPNSNSFLLGPFNTSLSFPQYTGLVEQQLRDYLDYYTQECPDTNLVLVGYSAGGVSTMNTLCGATVSPPWNRTQAVWMDYPIVAAVLYGEELQAANEPYDVGTCPNDAPHGHRDPSACTDFFPSMQSYCDVGDPQCCLNGTVQSEHYAYPGKYDLQAASFVYSKWSTYTRSTTATTSTSTTTSTTETTSTPTTTSTTETTSTPTTTTTHRHRHHRHHHKHKKTTTTTTTTMTSSPTNPPSTKV